MIHCSCQKQLYGIALFEQEIVLSDFTAGAERRFCVSPEQLMDFFRAEVTFRPFSGLVWMKSDGRGETYLIIYPAVTRTILYRRGTSPKRKRRGKDDLETHTLKLPAIAVRAAVESATRKIHSIDLWAFPGRELAAATVLYELPLPNLSGCRLCLGSTERAVDGDIRGAVERTIFDTPFNHHNHLVGTGKIPFHDYVAKYHGSCPLRTLNRIGEGRQILGGAQ